MSKEISKTNHAVGLVLMIGAAVLIAYVLYGIYFSKADNETADTVVTVTKLERLTSKNGMPFVKDCFAGREYVVAQYPSHAAMMAATGRDC